MLIEPSAALQVQQRSAAKSLKFEQFTTTSTSSNAKNDWTVGESNDILYDVVCKKVIKVQSLLPWSGSALWLV